MRWLTVYLDEPVEVAGRAWRLWRDVAGAVLSAPRGDDGEFATLLPAEGDAHLRVQATGATTSGVHLDLHVDDVGAATRRATGAGAAVVAGPAGTQDWAVLRSPAGFVLCLVPHEAEDRPQPPTTWSDGHRSRLDQLTVDVAHEHWDPEVRFWADLTGWEVTASASRPELARLATPPRLPVRVLLHRRRAGTTSGHVDVATDDREAEVARLELLGLRRVAHGPTWTVLQAPHGAALCVTDRDPVTGLLR